MTITPLPVLPPATRGGNPRAAEGKPGQPSPAQDFAAVLSGHLAGAKAAGPKAAAPQPDEPSTDAVPANAVPAEAATGAAAQLAGSVAVPVPAAAAASPATAPAAPAVEAAAVPAAPTTSTASTASTGEAGQVPADPAGTTARPDAQEPEPADHSRTATGTADADLPATGAVEGAGREAGAPAVATAPEHADTPAPGQAPVGVAPAAPTAGATPADAVKTAPAAPAPVLAQVSPALARVVSRGDGEHRMMLKLHPADLGEVHLTVTVRGNHVDVEIAASPQARDVLREGSAHLRSLLESIGRSSGQLVLRDLPVAPTHAAGQGSGGTGHDGGAATSYADTGDGRRDQPGTRGGRQQPHLADQPLDRPVVTPRASGRSTVPGGPALDVTV